VDIIVDAGKSHSLLPSTVIDLTQKRPRILREGAVPVSKLRPYLEEQDPD
jgi:L-threonylcarbamoyladenylate synthase